MVKSLGEIAGAINAELIGDANVEVADAKTTARSTSSDITFAANEKNLKKFLESGCLCAVVPQSLGVEKLGIEHGNFLVVDDAEASFISVVELFRPAIARKRVGISNDATIASSATVSEDVDIYPGVFIGEEVTVGCGAVIHPGVTVMDGSNIGAGTTLFPNVTIYENTVVGERCIIHGGVVIGAYGFGYKSGATHELSAQLGNVVIGDDVEIGSNTTIDRGTFDSTTIGDGTKIDDLVMIGHNCQIGKHNLLCSQVGIAGSTSTGDYVVMAGQVGVGDHLHIADKSVLMAQSGVMHNLAGDQQYLGSPAIPVREQMQLIASLNKLPDLRKKVRALQKWVDVQQQSTNETPSLAASKSQNEAA